MAENALYLQGYTVVVLLALASAATAQQGQPSPPPPATQGDAGSVQEVGGRLVLSGETVVVTANPDEPPRESSVATKIPTPLIETPRSISVIDRQTLDDLGVISLTQAHDYAVGVTLLDERGPAFARGFPVDFYDLRRDGLRTYSWSVREPAAVDRIQYLRGSAAIMYGDGSPGALVNMVLKKPLPTPRYEFSVAGGGLGFGRFTADLTGPMGGSRRVRYRVIAATEWLGNGFDNNERRLTLLPTVSMDIGARGTLTFDTEVYDQRGRSYRHVVPATAAAQRGEFSGYPWDLNVSSPDYGWTGGNVSPGLRLDLGLGPRSSLHVAGRYTKIDGDANVQAISGISADGRTAQRYQYHEVSTWHEYQTDTFAQTSIRTGRLEHRIVTGLEAGLSTTDSQIGVGAASPLDIATPVYPSAAEPVARPTRFNVSRVGLYAIDQVKLGARLIAVPSVRWSRLALENRVPVTGNPDSSDLVVSPGMGIVFLPRPSLSLYGSYARGFEAPAPGQYLESGLALDPARNGAIEGGVKADLLERRVSLTGAVFHITRTNIPEADGRGFYRQIGEGVSSGLEVEVVGSVARGLAIRGGYALTDTEVTRDVSGFVGRELPNAPQHKAEIWGRYRFDSSLVRGLMLAAGVVHTSNRFIARDNVVVAPAFTRVDLSGSYPLTPSRLTVGIVAQNIGNVRYVTSGAGAGLFAGQPRRLAVQLTTAF